MSCVPKSADSRSKTYVIGLLSALVRSIYYFIEFARLQGNADKVWALFLFPLEKKMDVPRRLPVVGVWVETGHLQGASLGFVGHLVDHHPVLVLSHHTHLGPRPQRA